MGAIQRAFVQLLLLKSRKMPSYELWYRFSNLQLLPLLPIGKKKMTALNSKPSNKCLIICLGFNADVSYLSLALILSALLFSASSRTRLHRFRGRLMTWKWRFTLGCHRIGGSISSLSAPVQRNHDKSQRCGKEPTDGKNGYHSGECADLEVFYESDKQIRQINRGK
jgi:hypothetical protein